MISRQRLRISHIKEGRAKNRRVEVWLVPRPGKGPMPAGLNLQDLPAADLPKESNVKVP